MTSIPSPGLGHEHERDRDEELADTGEDHEELLGSVTFEDDFVSAETMTSSQLGKVKESKSKGMGKGSPLFSRASSGRSSNKKKKNSFRRGNSGKEDSDSSPRSILKQGRSRQGKSSSEKGVSVKDEEQQQEQEVEDEDEDEREEREGGDDVSIPSVELLADDVDIDDSFDLLGKDEEEDVIDEEEEDESEEGDAEVSEKVKVEGSSKNKNKKSFIKGGKLIFGSSPTKAKAKTKENAKRASKTSATGTDQTPTKLPPFSTATPRRDRKGSVTSSSALSASSTGTGSKSFGGSMLGSGGSVSGMGSMLLQRVLRKRSPSGASSEVASQLSVQTLTPEPAQNEEELGVEMDIREQLRARLVFGQGSPTYGLRWRTGTVNDPNILIGGWVNAIDPKSLKGRRPKAKLLFLVLDDQAGLLKQCTDESQRCKRSLRYEDIYAARARCTKGVWYVEILARQNTSGARNFDNISGGMNNSNGNGAKTPSPSKPRRDKGGAGEVAETGSKWLPNSSPLVRFAAAASMSTPGATRMIQRTAHDSSAEEENETPGAKGKQGKQQGEGEGEGEGDDSSEKKTKLSAGGSNRSIASNGSRSQLLPNSPASLAPGEVLKQRRQQQMEKNLKGSAFSTAEGGGKPLRWAIMGVSPEDSDTVARWTAAIQHRSAFALYGDLLEDHAAALRVVLWLQSMYRMRKARDKARKRRERQQGFLAKWGRWLVGLGGSDWFQDEEEEDDDEDEDEDGNGDGDGNEKRDGTAKNSGRQGNNGTVLKSGQQHATTDSNGEETGLGSLFSWIQTWIGYQEDVQATQETEEERKAREKVKRQSAWVQFSKELPPLEWNEIEEEIWENQRWQAVPGWDASSLLPGERGPFTDRLGRGSMKEPPQKDPPKGWKWTTADWEVDKSGLPAGKCDPDGWVYQMTFAGLDSDLAKGRFKAQAGGIAGYPVRRRRLYRRRKFDIEAARKAGMGTIAVDEDGNRQAILGKSPVLCEGWLGIKNPRTGRWKSRLCALTHRIQIGGDKGTTPQVAQGQVALVVFSPTWRELSEKAEELGLNGGFGVLNLSPNKVATAWRELTKEQAKAYIIDRSHFEVDLDVATASRPGLFSLRFNAKSKRHVFNAQSASARDDWIAQIRAALSPANNLKDSNGDGSHNESATPAAVSSAESEEYDGFDGGTGETADAGTIGLPPKAAFHDPAINLPNAVLDAVLPMPVEQAMRICFDSKEFLDAVYDKQGLRKLKVGKWSDGLNFGSQRRMVYQIPSTERQGEASQGETRQKVTRSQASIGYVVDERISATHKEFGDCFVVCLRTVMSSVGRGGGGLADLRTRVIVSMDCQFLTSTMMQGYIISSSKRDIVTYYSNVWVPVLNTFLGKGKKVKESRNQKKKRIASGRIKLEKLWD